MAEQQITKETIKNTLPNTSEIITEPKVEDKVMNDNQTIKDVETKSKEDEVIKNSDAEIKTDVTTVTQDKIETKTITVDVKTVVEPVTEMEEKIKTLEYSLSEKINSEKELSEKINKLSEKLESIEKDNQKLQLDKRIICVKTFCDKLLTDGNYPAVVKTVEKMLLAEVKSPISIKLTENNQEIVLSLRDIIKAVLDSYPTEAKVDLTEQTKSVVKEPSLEEKYTDEYIKKRFKELKLN